MYREGEGQVEHGETPTNGVISFESFPDDRRHQLPKKKKKTT